LSIDNANVRQEVKEVEAILGLSRAKRDELVIFSAAAVQVM
jgi:hypothetical protein